MQDPKLFGSLQREKVVLQMSLTQPDATLVVDGRSNPVRFATGTPVARPDIGLRLSADTLHNIWLSKIRLRDAFAAGTVKLDTSPVRALSLVNSLTDLFRYIERLYPQVLRERGLL
jgi:putative sterol carrier protein